MLLITDGTPTLNLNCEPGQCTNDLPGSEQPVIDEIAAAYADYGIKTFVLGCSGSEGHLQAGRDNRWWLSQAAELGGTSRGNCSHEAEPYCHFDLTGADVNFAEELNNALGDIVAEVTRCHYAVALPLPGENIDSDLINLIVRPDGGDPILISRDKEPGCEQGWYYDEARSLFSTGLVRNWGSTDGGSASGCNYDYADDYGDDAARTPWRIGTDYLWWGTAAAKSWLDRVIAWVSSQDPSALGQWYHLDGTFDTSHLGYDDHTAITLGPWAVGAMAYEQATVDSLAEELLSIPTSLGSHDAEYFARSLRALTLLTLTGHFTTCGGD
jgi:hypothetical protein